MNENVATRVQGINTQDTDNFKPYIVVKTSVPDDGEGDAMHCIKVAQAIRKAEEISKNYKVLFILAGVSVHQDIKILNRMHSCGLIPDYNDEKDTAETLTERYPDIYILRRMSDEPSDLVEKYSHVQAVCHVSGEASPPYFDDERVFFLHEVSVSCREGYNDYVIGSHYCGKEYEPFGFFLEGFGKPRDLPAQAEYLTQLSDTHLTGFLEGIDDNFRNSPQKFLQDNLITTAFFRLRGDLFLLNMEFIIDSELSNPYNRLIFMVPSTPEFQKGEDAYNNFVSSLKSWWHKLYKVSKVVIHSGENGQSKEIDAFNSSYTNNSLKSEYIEVHILIAYFSEHDYKLLSHINHFFRGVSGDTSIQEAIESARLPLLMSHHGQRQVFANFIKYINRFFDDELKSKYAELKEYLKNIQNIGYETYRSKDRRTKAHGTISRLMTDALLDQWGAFCKFLYDKFNGFDTIRFVLYKALLEGAKNSTDVPKIEDEIKRLSMLLEEEQKKIHSRNKIEELKEHTPEEWDPPPSYDAYYNESSAGEKQGDEDAAAERSGLKGSCSTMFGTPSCSLDSSSDNTPQEESFTVLNNA